MKEDRLEAISRDMPTFVEIFPTLTCNRNCPTCDRGQESSELEDFKDIKVLYDNLRKDPDCYLTGFRISGREPLLYPRINALIAFLRRLDPRLKISLFTNGLALKRLTKKSLSLVDLQVSIYPATRTILRGDPVAAGILKAKKIPVKVNFRHHEDLRYPGTQRSGLDPLAFCFSAVLLCATKKVYPCCRAHRFEQMFQKKYHCRIDTKDLYQRLKSIIKDTDLCVHCPRMYKDSRHVVLS
jgi:hypothetical protein